MSANGMFPAMDASGPAVSRFIHLLSAKRAETVTDKVRPQNWIVGKSSAPRARRDIGARSPIFVPRSRFPFDILFRAAFAQSDVGTIVGFVKDSVRSGGAQRERDHPERGNGRSCTPSPRMSGTLHGPEPAPTYVQHDTEARDSRNSPVPTTNWTPIARSRSMPNSRSARQPRRSK